MVCCSGSNCNQVVWTIYFILFLFEITLSVMYVIVSVNLCDVVRNFRVTFLVAS